MAGKSRRVAVRQGQLNRRKKKTQRGPSGIPSPVVTRETEDEPQALPVSKVATPEAPETGVDDLSVLEEAEARVRNEGRRAPRPAPPARGSRAVGPQGPGRFRGEPPAAYNFVGAELRRITILSSVIIAALIVLGILL